MNIFTKMYARTFQGVMYLATFVLPWRKPQIFTDDGQFADKVVARKHSKVLLVTDAGITKIGLYKSLVDALESRGVTVTIFDETVPNPTIANIEKGLSVYKEVGATALVAFGGGSSMDCAKGIGARVARPRKSVQKMRGLLKILKKIPDFFAVPTTAGSGSETTLAAVVTDEKTHTKYAINDVSLIPHFALLDAKLTVGLPPHITSTTGMDALCHAVEAYIGSANTRATKRAAVEATKLIYDNIVEAYSNPTNLEARGNMLKASNLAGIAFTRAYVGNVHAVSHAMSGKYSTPHGLGNAVALPVVLSYYGKSAHTKLAKLADVVGIEGNSCQEKAEKFIASILQLNVELNIPTVIADIVEEDIPTMVHNAFKESVPLYPVPMLLDKKDLTSIYMELMAK